MHTTTSHAGPRGKDTRVVRRQKTRGWGGSLYWDASHGRASRLGLASLNNFGGLWTTGVAPSCVALALG